MQPAGDHDYEYSENDDKYSDDDDDDYEKHDDDDDDDKYDDDDDTASAVHSVSGIPLAAACPRLSASHHSDDNDDDSHDGDKENEYDYDDYMIMTPALRLSPEG